MRILITGGAGFIGSHLVDSLLDQGHEVTVYDNLDAQVHGEGQKLPDYFNTQARFILGDVRDRDSLKKALEGVEVIFHLASAVGVGQSMHQIRRYTDVNSLGTATLLDIVANDKNCVEKLVLSSSMSLFGEGTYRCDNCGVVYPRVRSLEQLHAREWELRCPSCQEPVAPLATDEEKPLFPVSVYATTKRDQEEMFCQIGFNYGIPTVVLRYFNVYGPRQALSNPYTAVVAIFSNCILGNVPPVVFEDGLQTRDFVHVSDVVQANLLVLEKHKEGVEIFNVGTGVATSLLDLAGMLGETLPGGKRVSARVVGRFRAGDIRHCFADPAKIRSQLGFSPQVPLRQGIGMLAQWLQSQTSLDVISRAIAELEQKGLVK